MGVVGVNDGLCPGGIPGVPEELIYQLCMNLHLDALHGGDIPQQGGLLQGYRLPLGVQGDMPCRQHAAGEDQGGGDKNGRNAKAHGHPSSR